MFRGCHFSVTMYSSETWHLLYWGLQYCGLERILTKSEYPSPQGLIPQGLLNLEQRYLI